jgi:SAM-dependent methyltransferase
MDETVQALRLRVFSRHWPLDDELRATVAGVPSHSFLYNPAGQYGYVYLTRFVKALCEAHNGRPFAEQRLLDWGCGKGFITKMMRDLEPGAVESCDIVSSNEDSAFGQKTPVIQRFKIEVKPLKHEFLLPYEDGRFDAVLSVGVLEHVPNDRASLAEIWRVLKPGGLLFCFFLPTNLSWTQKLAHLRGNFYHDRFYNEASVQEKLNEARFEMLDLWYRNLLPKNTVRYPSFRLFERADQILTEHTPLRYFATNVEFVAQKTRT